MFQFAIFSIDNNESQLENILLISKVFFNCFKCTIRLLPFISNLFISIKGVNS